jgi:predicted HicB family RNase H-like nuclease
MFNDSGSLITNTKSGSSMGERRKSRTIGIRVDPDLYEQLQTQADATGQSVSTYVRSTVIMRLNGTLVIVQKKQFNEY